MELSGLLLQLQILVIFSQLR